MKAVPHDERNQWRDGLAVARNRKRLRRRSDVVTAGRTLKAHGISDTDHNSRCPDFCFHYTSTSGYSVEDCDAEAKIALIDALWQRSRMTWAEITNAPRQGLGTEKIPRHALKVGIPRGITEDVTVFLVLRFGAARRLIGFRERSVFHIVWVDPKHAVYSG